MEPCAILESGTGKEVAVSLSKTEAKGGLAAKLLAILHESRWRGDISLSEYYLLQRYLGGLPEAKKELGSARRFPK
jgi:hypothetical protein